MQVTSGSRLARTGSCLLCGTVEDLTVEHIIPQTLWSRFGIDPNRDDLARFRTTLCVRHNQATSALHSRNDMMKLIETGEPVTRTTLRQLGDWAVWVTFLLSLARGSGVLGAAAARDALLRRFDAAEGGPPKGMRVYAARATDHVGHTGPPVTPYALALCGDTRVLLDHGGQPTGFSVRGGPITASESIGLGRVALLVVGRTYTSGVEHHKRLDEAVAQVGLQRILPLSGRVPYLSPRPVSMSDVSKLFTVVPFGADLSLMPKAIQALIYP